MKINLCILCLFSCLMNLTLLCELKAETTEITSTRPFKAEAKVIGKIVNLSEQNKSFTGRKQELERIVEVLFKTKENILIIEGISGIGKTQLAKKYAYSFLDKYDLIWWFDGDKNLESQIDKLLIELYLRKNKPYYRPANSLDLLRKFKQELSIFKGNWLIVVDNLDDTSLIGEYISKNNDSFSKHVIVTSKKMNKTFPSMTIHKFQRKESLNFLSKNLEKPEKEDLNALAEALEDFPLALAQAVSYIKMNPSINVNTYLQLFKENHSELWKSEQKLIENAETKPSLNDHYNKTISTAIKINLDSIKSSSPLAYKILTFCSLLDHQHIPSSALEHWACSKLGATKLEFHETLSLLLNNFLLEKEITPNAQQELELLNQHELIRLITLDTISDARKKEMLNEASEYLLQELTQSPGTLFEQFKGKEYFSNHLEKICNLAEELRCEDRKIIELKIVLLYFIHFIQRDFERSSKFIKDLKGLVENDSDLSPLAQLWFYCTYCNDQMFEDLSKVQQIYQKGLKCLEKIYDTETKRGYFIHLNMNYMESLSNFGKIKEAISICDSLEETLKMSNNRSEKTAFLGVSAITRLKYGQYDRTLKDLDHCLELISEEKGDDKFIPLLMLVKAHCLLYQTQTQKAYQIIEEYYPYLLEIFATPDCMVLVKSKFIKGACLASFGKLDEAQHIVEKTLKSYEKSTGFENDSLKGMGYCILGEIFEAKGDLTKAYEEYIKAEKLYDKILQEKSLDDLSRLYTRLAILGAKLGDNIMANKYLSLQIDIFGLAHPRTFEIKDYLNQNGFTLP